MFWREYIDRSSPWGLAGFETQSRDGVVRCVARVNHLGQTREIRGEGNGPISAFVHALVASGAPKFEVINYSEHALGSGEEASAIAYIQVKAADGRLRWGAAVDANIELASIRAVLSALNRLG